MDAKFSMINQLKTVFRPEVSYSIAARLVQAIGGIGTMLLISLYLSEIEQGYYYAIQSLAASYVLFEMGLSNTLVNFFSNQSSDSSQSNNKSHDTARKLFAGSLILYLVMSVVAVLALLILGYMYLISEQRSDLVTVWVLITASIGINLNLLPHTVFIEAKGGVISTNKMRLVQAVFSLACLWAGLASGLGILSLAIYFCAMSLSQLLFILGRKSHITLISKLAISIFDFKKLVKQIFSTQLKVSLTWMFGYFTSAGLVPVIMKIHSPEIAGKFGMALQITTLVLMVSYSLISTRVPFWGAALAASEVSDFKRDFRKRQYAAFILYFLGAVAVLSSIYILIYMKVGFTSRILEPSLLGLLFLNGFFTLSVLCDAAYIRINKVEIHHYQSILYSIVFYLSLFLALKAEFQSHVLILLACNIIFGFGFSKFLKQIYIHRLTT